MRSLCVFLPKRIDFEPRLRPHVPADIVTSAVFNGAADMRAYLKTQTTLLKERPDCCGEIVPPELAPVDSPAELAAWAALASVLLNTDEFITRE